MMNLSRHLERAQKFWPSREASRREARFRLYTRQSAWWWNLIKQIPLCKQRGDSNRRHSDNSEFSFEPANDDGAVETGPRARIPLDKINIV